MTVRILLLEPAEQDLFSIHQFVEAKEGPAVADGLLAHLEEAVRSLAQLPERGHWPPELERLGIRHYREIHYKPYRIVYVVEGEAVIVHAVLDGRRDMQTLLRHRMLR